MENIFKTIRQHAVNGSPWLDKLAGLFSAMDAGYEEAAGGCGFVCRGCDDNCCRTRFHHHTLLEFIGICRGYLRLGFEERKRVLARATEYCRQHAEADAAGTSVKPWCPLNKRGRCLVYDLRPMICRLHGIPHVLHLPDGQAVQGPGCAYFTSCHETENCAALDRTPFYKALAGLEKQLRAGLNVEIKFKQTIAEMILICQNEGSGDCPETPQGEVP